MTEQKSLMFLYELFQELIGRKYIGEEIVGITDPVEKNGGWVCYFGEDMNIFITSPEPMKYRIFNHYYDITAATNVTKGYPLTRNSSYEEVIKYCSDCLVEQAIEDVVNSWEKENYYYGKDEDRDYYEDEI